jgi:hypothetical protein
MIGGHFSVAREVDVAPVAIAQSPLITVLMAAETRRHLRKNRVRTGFGDLGVTADAVAVDLRQVPRVVEAQLRLNDLDCVAHVRFAVTAEARAAVVRLRMAADTIRGRRQMHPRRARTPDVPVAFEAVDPFDDMRAMLEGVRRELAVEPEHTCARGQEDHAQSEKARGCLHGLPERPAEARRSRGASNVRETRTSPSTSYRCRGDADASTAAATSQPSVDRHEREESAQGHATPRPAGTSGTTTSISLA